MVNSEGSGAVVSLINNLTKAQTLMAASRTEEESARHQVALVQNLFKFTLYKYVRGNARKTERYIC